MLTKEECVEAIETLKEKYIGLDVVDELVAFNTLIKEHFDHNEKADQWIPVEERMPEEHDTIFAKFKGTDKWNESMMENISDEVNVTIQYHDGSRKTTTSRTVDGVWTVEKKLRIINPKVIAWMPLPDVYEGQS